MSRGLGDVYKRQGNDIKSLTKPTEKLQVLRPIGGYEPVGHKFMGFLEHEMKADNAMRRTIRTLAKTPKNWNIKRFIERKLTGQDLMKIFVHPKAINLGKIFVKSKEKRNFCIKNEMNIHIKARVCSELEELKESYFEPQIIPPF